MNDVSKSKTPKWELIASAVVAAILVLVIALALRGQVVATPVVAPKPSPSVTASPSGLALPADFPKVPLMRGTLLKVEKLGSEKQLIWNASISTTKTLNVAAIPAALTAAGFMVQDRTPSAGNENLIATNKQYAVLVVVTKDASGAWFASYVITNNTNN
jgi:hypothetical protein